MSNENESGGQLCEIEDMVSKAVKKPELVKRIMIQIQVYGSLRWNEGVRAAEYDDYEG